MFALYFYIFWGNFSNWIKMSGISFFLTLWSARKSNMCLLRKGTKIRKASHLIQLTSMIDLTLMTDFISYLLFPNPHHKRFLISWNRLFWAEKLPRAFSHPIKFHVCRGYNFIILFIIHYY